MMANAMLPSHSLASCALTRSALGAGDIGLKAQPQLACARQLSTLHSSVLRALPSVCPSFENTGGTKRSVVVNFNGLKACPALRQTATVSRPESLPRLSITAAAASNFQKEGPLKSLQSLTWASTKASAHESSFTVHASAAATDAPAVVAPSKQKIRIKLRSYWVDLVEQACKQILDAGKNTNAQTMGPVPLPTRRRIYCLLRSPHVDKDSREHFEIRTHRRLIDLANPTAQTIDALMQLDLPAGVDVEVKLS